MEYTVSSQNVHDQNFNMSAHGFEYFKSAGKIMLIQIFLENMEYTYSMDKPGIEVCRSRLDIHTSTLDLCRSRLDVCRSEVMHINLRYSEL